MDKMNMANRMILRFQNMEAHWSKDALDVCERFFQASALMQADEYLGFQIVKDEELGYQAGAFSCPNVWISEKDYQWIFEPCASVEELSAPPQKEFEGKDQWLYVLQRDVTGQKSSRVDKSDKSFGKRFWSFLDLLWSFNASLRIVARPGRENGRGLLYFSLPQMMTLRLETMIMLLFPGTEIKSVSACGEAVLESKWLPLLQMTDGAMCIMGMLKKQEEETKPEDLGDDGLFDFEVEDDEFPTCEDPSDEPPTDDEAANGKASDATKENHLRDNVSIEELELSVRAFNCLKRAGINTVGDLRKLSDEDFMKIRNLGRKSADEVKEKLAEFGVKMAETKKLPKNLANSLTS